MKNILLITFLFLFACKQEKKNNSAYSSLDLAIADGVIFKSIKSPKIIMSQYNITDSNLVFRAAPAFLQLLKTNFNVNDTSAIRNILLQSVPLDSAIRSRASRQIVFARDTSANLMYGPDSEPVIDVFYKLITGDGNRCLVLLHWVQGGVESAFLEKTGGQWKVVSVQTETLE